MHENGVYHFDLKPGNTGVTAAGRVKIYDFGVSSKMGARKKHATPDFNYVGVNGDQSDTVVLVHYLHYFCYQVDMEVYPGSSNRFFFSVLSFFSLFLHADPEFHNGTVDKKIQASEKLKMFNRLAEYSYQFSTLQAVFAKQDQDRDKALRELSKTGLRRHVTNILQIVFTEYPKVKFGRGFFESRLADRILEFDVKNALPEVVLSRGIQ